MQSGAFFSLKPVDTTRLNIYSNQQGEVRFGHGCGYSPRGRFYFVDAKGGI